ncbi:alpha/beta hydrolase family protein [Ferrimonas sediminicola]|uniref:alpha/beta hydrolase family protein n=1 Tax=Ferrimonas sediminicola TaxID=2569538 RepID=UPI00145CB291|nr:S9 family peptidase [Ferrimonas sediminicola]
MTRFLAGLAMMLALPAWADLPPVEHFSRSSQAYSIKISPKGDHLAMMTKNDGKQFVAILDTDTLKPLHAIRFGGQAQVGSYWWASNDRVVVTKEYLKGWTAAPQSYGEMLAVDFDGDDALYLFGYDSGKKTTGTRLARGSDAIRAWGYMIDPLPEDEDWVLIQSTPMGHRGERNPTVFRANIHNGKRKKVAYSPVSFARFISDHRGEIRFVSGVDKDGVFKMYAREEQGDEWRLFFNEEAGEGTITPVTFASKDEVYVLDNTDHSLQALKRVNLKTGESTLIYRDKVVDPRAPKLSADGRTLYAMEVEPGYPSYIFVDSDSRDSKSLKGLLQAFPGEQVAITSQTLDGNLAVVFVYSDINPGSYYLYDRGKGSVRHLVSARSWVDPDSSATVEPFSFKARDGMTLYGYLTIPAGKEAKNLPLVVNPHGGPHGPRDYWRYDPQAQLLASRGMAVLQVNFRGSGGYGRDYQEAGYRNWGSKIQYDIIDATQHMIAQGKVDRDNICIYGGSFGGYSALQAPILAPDLFQCAIGFAGVYDLELMYEVGDIPEHKSGMRYLKEVIGEDDTNMKAFSPVHNVDKLTLPLLIIHGGEDERVPIEHAQMLREALDKKKHPYKWLELEKEAHGLYDEQTRTEVYGEMLSFLEQHLTL